MDNLNERFQKIFVIDINPGNDPLTKELVIGRFSRVIKNASLYQTVVIMGHSNLSLLKHLVLDIGVKSGYIISDNGARIYSIHEDKIVYDNSLDRDQVMAAIHYGIMTNSLVLVSASQREYAYSLNLLNTLNLNKKHYLPLPYTNDYSKLMKFVGSTSVHSLLVFHKDRQNMLKVLDDINKITKDWKIVAQGSQASYFMINDNKDSKYNAILKIMEVKNIMSTEKVYYYAINTINDLCVKSFKHHLIHQDVALSSDYYNKINIQASTDTIIADLRQAFFGDIEQINNKYTTREIMETKRLNEIMRDLHTRKIKQKA